MVFVGGRAQDIKRGMRHSELLLPRICLPSFGDLLILLSDQGS